MRWLFAGLAAFVFVAISHAAWASACPTASTGTLWATNNAGGTSLRSDVDDGTNSSKCAGTVNLGLIGGVAVTLDPCQAQMPITVPINITASGTTEIIAGSSGKHTYFCKIGFPPQQGAVEVAPIEGTGGTCGTGTFAFMGGGTTAATGFSVLANSGWVEGEGLAWVEEAANALGDNICLVTTAALIGSIKYVQQ